jgi:hypothetical protein
LDVDFIEVVGWLQIEKSRSDKGSFSSMPAMHSMRFDNGFSDINTSGGGGFGNNASSFGMDADTFKPKGMRVRSDLDYMLLHWKPLWQPRFSSYL